MAERKRLEIEQTHGNCACDGCGSRTHDVTVIVHPDLGYGATICCDCMTELTTHWLHHSPPPELVRLREFVEEIKQADVHEVDYLRFANRVAASLRQLQDNIGALRKSEDGGDGR